MIVVTGGAGFIGSAIVWALNLRGLDDIIIADDLGTSDKWKNLRGLQFKEIITKDALVAMFGYDNDETLEMDEDEVLDDIGHAESNLGIEAIIHMGACSDTTERDAGYLLDNNYGYSKFLAINAVRRGIRFIYASSAATYGDGSLGYDDNEDELEKLRPLNMYGYSKQLFDVWAKREGLFDIIAGLKFSNVFGPNEYHKAGMRSMVVQAFEQIQERGTIRLFKSYLDDYADGEQMRDFVYIKDAVAMVLFFLDNPEVCGIYNVGAGKARTWNDLANAAFDALGKKPRIEYIDMPDQLINQYQYFTELKMDKIINAGYARPSTSLEDGIADYVKNYLVGGDYLDALDPGAISIS